MRSSLSLTFHSPHSSPLDFKTLRRDSSVSISFVCVCVCVPPSSSSSPRLFIHRNLLFKYERDVDASHKRRIQFHRKMRKYDFFEKLTPLLGKIYQKVNFHTKKKFRKKLDFLKFNFVTYYKNSKITIKIRKMFIVISR